ncbi:MAG TPA: co-chaperone GroES [Candidatus Paceibacterota bacterium]|nr:co-chaperone GroES [Candidatus Paceibacterota bacterium]
MPKEKNRKNGNNRGENSVRIKPLGDKILLRPISTEEKKSSFGIIIPETVSKEKPEQGKVVAVGEGKFDESGKLISVRVKVGDRVLFSKYGYDEIKIDDEEYLIVSENQILAVIK